MKLRCYVQEETTADGALPDVGYLMELHVAEMDVFRVCGRQYGLNLQMSPSQINTVIDLDEELENYV